MRAFPSALPYLTADLPGTGGVLRASTEDFRVEEIPAYMPAGEGDHVFVWLEKRDLSTPQAAEHLARALGVRARDIGWAGMKDRRALTRQWLSLPPPCTPEAARALDLPGITVLEAARHRHKLRTGHLRGNRFTLRVRDTEVDAESAAARARAILDRLGQPPGSPNWFGAQRFGAGGRNAEMGRALLAGSGPGAPRGRQKRLYISALQSALFNDYLARRLRDDLLGRVIPGDVLQKRHTGGLFATSAPEVDQARLEAGELVPTGPMFGRRMRRPPPDTAAAAREDQVLAAADLAVADFDRAGKLGAGTRRALAVDIGRTTVAPAGERAIELSFGLPSGAYATALLREVIKGSNPFPG